MSDRLLLRLEVFLRFQKFLIVGRNWCQRDFTYVLCQFYRGMVFFWQSQRIVWNAFMFTLGASRRVQENRYFNNERVKAFSERE